MTPDSTQATEALDRARAEQDTHYEQLCSETIGNTMKELLDGALEENSRATDDQSWKTTEPGSKRNSGPARPTAIAVRGNQAEAVGKGSLGNRSGGGGRWP